MGLPLPKMQEQFEDGKILISEPQQDSKSKHVLQRFSFLQHELQ